MSFGFSFGDIVTAIELVKGLRSRFVDAPPQYQAINAELRGLFIVLEDIDAVLPHRTLTDKEKDNLQCLTDTCRDVAEDLRRKLSNYQEIDPNCRSNNPIIYARRVWKRVKWEPQDIAELRGRIVSTVLLLTQFHSKLVSQRATEESSLIRDDITTIKQTQLSQKLSEELEKIAEWLTPIEYYSQQNEVFKQRQEKTGQWLLSKPDYQAWMNGTKTTLLSLGMPGAGKTSFASLVIRHLEDKFGHDPEIGITYLYVNYHRREEQEPAELLASLVKQLILHQMKIPESIKALYDRHQPRRSRPTVLELIDVYALVARTYSKIFIVLDALDEYEDSHGSRRLFVSSIFKLQSTIAINLFTTSRHIPEIQATFEKHGSTLLQIRATDEDIERYVVGRLPQLPSFVLSDDALQSEVILQIKNAVDGMFLLAKFHFDSLIGKRSPKALRNTLQNLPKGTDSYSCAYDMVMERINDQPADAKELANQALSWIVCSQRPFFLVELQQALSLEEGDSEIDEENFSTIDDILSVCAGLLVLSQGGRTVSLIHYTAQEYFKQNLASWVSSANTVVSTCCITYLSFDGFSSGPCKDMEHYNSRSMEFRLFDYCAHNWGHHTSEALSTVKPILIKMLKKAGNRASCWQAVRFQGDHWQGKWQNDWQISALHLLVTFGLATLVQDLVNEGFPADSRDSMGRTPLSYAASYGNEALAQALLEHGVQINSEDNDGRTPVSYAAAHGYDTVVQALLQRGADIDSHDHKGHTPLFYAAQNGHYKVVCILLDKNAKTHSHDAHGRIPLSYAAWYGREDVLDILLREGAQPDIKDDYGRTILSYAASSGNEGLVRTLLDRGAEVNSTDHSGRSPLFYAAWNENEAVCRLLILRGADAGLHDKNSRIPLCYAAMSGKVAIVKLLLEQTHGIAQIDNRDCSGRTPLSYAASSGNSEMIECFLEYEGVNTASSDITGRTPLFYATYKGDMAAVKLLLSRAGGNPLTESNIGRSPLSIAENARYSAIHALLIDECKCPELDVSHMDRLEPTEFAAIHLPFAGCDACMSWILSFDIAYHCALCNTEGYDLCRECFANNPFCQDSSHKLVKSRYCNGQWVEVP